MKANAGESGELSLHLPSVRHRALFSHIQSLAIPALPLGVTTAPCWTFLSDEEKKSSLSAKCPLRKLLPSTGFLKTVVLCLPYLNLLHLLQCSQKKALLTFFSMQCWVCVMPALCNWKSFFLFHKSTGTFWKIQNTLHIEDLSSRSGSGWQRYTVVLYYLGPADTVDR